MQNAEERVVTQVSSHLASFVAQGQQTQHPAFQHVVNPRGAPNRHQVRGGVKPGAYPRPAVYDSGYRNVNKRKATRRGDEQIPYGRKQGDCPSCELREPAFLHLCLSC